MLSYSEVAPSAPLARFVKCFWTLRGNAGDAPPVERIFPDGAFELVFHFGDPFVANGGAQPHAMLVGQIRRPTLVTPSRNADVLGVRFHVGGTAAFFRAPMSEFRDHILPAHEGTNEIIDVRTIASVERFLLRRLAPPDRWDIAREAIALIARHRGRLRSRELTRITGLFLETAKDLKIAGSLYFEILRRASPTKDDGDFFTHSQDDGGFFTTFQDDDVVKSSGACLRRAFWGAEGAPEARTTPKAATWLPQSKGVRTGGRTARRSA